jgi:hypothetical protein
LEVADSCMPTAIKLVLAQASLWAFCSVRDISGWRLQHLRLSDCLAWYGC